MARSVTLSVRTSGVLVTRIPRSRHLPRSTRSIPTEKEATISRAGRASMSAASALCAAFPTTARTAGAWVRRKLARPPTSGGASQRRMRRQRRSSSCYRYGFIANEAAEADEAAVANEALQDHACFTDLISVSNWPRC